MMRQSKVIMSLVIFVFVPAASAKIIFDGSPGTGPPPTTLGGWEMTPFPLDERPLWEDVVSVPSPLGGELDLGVPMRHVTVGQGWAFIGHVYEGDVYASFEHYSTTLTLPPGTVAFYFYLSPNGWGTFHVTADDGTTSGEMTGYWSMPSPFLGFYATDGDTIESLAISVDRTFGIADFGIAVPEPATVVIVTLGGLAGLRRCRPHLKQGDKG